MVLSVRRGAEPFALKLIWRPEGTEEQVRALRLWDGNGIMRLFEADIPGGALLLERLDPARSLSTPPLFDAAAAAGGLLRRLAIPAPPGFRDVRSVVAGTVRALEAALDGEGGPVPREWLQTALDLARDFAQNARTDRLIHADLHYDNILAGARESWLAIDPQPMASEPESAIGELLWTRLEDAGGEDGILRLLDVLVQSAGLDARRARDWAIVRCVDYWLWGVEHGLTQDPVRCRRILQALL